MGENLGLRTAGVIGINDNVSSDIFDVLLPFAQLINPSPLQTLRIETDFFTEGKSK